MITNNRDSFKYINLVGTYKGHFKENLSLLSENVTEVNIDNYRAHPGHTSEFFPPGCSAGACRCR